MVSSAPAEQKEPEEPPKKEAKEAKEATEAKEAKDPSSPQAKAAAKAEQPSAAGSSSGVLARLGCGRRKPQEVLDKERSQRYRDLFLLGRKISEKRKEWYEKLAWWSDCKTKQGSRIFVLAPRGPKGEHDVWIYMWELLGYAVTKMHEYVISQDNTFSIVWVQFGDHRMWVPSMTQFREALLPKYAKNFEALHVVHPSWGVRILRLLLWPIAPDDFWERFHAHERIEFLDQFVDLRKFRLPSDIYEHDKWLDKQAIEMNEQAKARGLGGLGSGMVGASEEERKKQQEQMQQLRQMMQSKGYKQS